MSDEDWLMARPGAYWLIPDYGANKGEYVVAIARRDPFSHAWTLTIDGQDVTDLASTAFSHWVKIDKPNSTSEREATINEVLELLRSLPSRGLYRLGGGHHAPSYDDAWRVAALVIKEELRRKSEVPK